MEHNSIDVFPYVHVGILESSRIELTLNGTFSIQGNMFTNAHFELSLVNGKMLWLQTPCDSLEFIPQTSLCSLMIENVKIGIGFHWEREQHQTFKGSFKFVVNEDKILVINEISVEEYLQSVISSEMRSTSSMEFLKAAAIISRSWLLRQMINRKNPVNTLLYSKDKHISNEEIFTWQDREDHILFDVCADDHCQRYQGISGAHNPQVVRAVQETAGKVLMFGEEICDARFSKCCGGVSEDFETCWENKHVPYLSAIRDTQYPEQGMPDLTQEVAARAWIRSNPESFCSTQDKTVLAQVLQDYDQETPDFYRWQVTYSQEELQQLISNRLSMDFGQILQLVPLKRGRSGRICLLKIVGSKRALTIGKELTIRRALSQSHLYSSAFVVEAKNIQNGVPGQFVLYGAGWGHGVGMCQIGAAVMGAQGYGFQEILQHYYPGAEIKKQY